MAPEASKKRKKKVQVRTSDQIFERAYIYYRKNQNRDALTEIAKGDENEPRFIELKAQLLYRLERCDEALELFNKLLKKHSDEFDDTRRANMLAVIALRESKGVHQQAEQGKLETFEQMYNCACHLIEQEKFSEARQLLDKTIVKCRETLIEEEGMSEKEVEQELAVIQVQKAYVFQKMGLNEEAVKLYLEARDNISSDENLKATITNNLQSIEVVDSKSGPLEARPQLNNIIRKKKFKLSQQQKHTVAFNLALLHVKPTDKETFQEVVTGKLNQKKRKRKPKLPKNYDPNVPPDPERWLPRQERTAYKKKLNKKFKDRDIGRGTQGAASSQTQSNANIDYSKASSAEPSPRVLPSHSAAAATAEGPRQQRPAGAQPAKKAKKKKGGKW